MKTLDIKVSNLESRVNDLPHQFRGSTHIGRSDVVQRSESDNKSDRDSEIDTKEEKKLSLDKNFAKPIRME